jgi:outer membrane receptor for monomeric catechols
MTVMIRFLTTTCAVLLLAMGTGFPDLAYAASKGLKQQESDSLPSTWSKTFTTFSNYPAVVIATADGGYLMAGSKEESAKDTGSDLIIKHFTYNAYSQ